MRNSKIYLFAIILLFSSCSANYHIKKAKKICPECFKTDTTINEIIFKLDTIIRLDTLILVKLPNDTIKIDSLVFKTIKPSFDKITNKNGIITTEVSMLKGRLNVVSFLDSSFYYRLQDSIRIKDAKIYELREVVINKDIVIKKERSFKHWLKIGLITSLSIICLGLVLIVVRIAKKIK